MDEHSTKETGNDGRCDLARVPKNPDDAQHADHAPNDGPKQICLFHTYSFEMPNRKSAVHPVISQMIATQSGLIFVVFPEHNAVILTCCPASVESGHKRAATSFFNTFLPCSLARAIACSIRIIIRFLFRIWPRNRGICKCMNQQRMCSGLNNPRHSVRGPLSLKISVPRHIPGKCHLSILPSSFWYIWPRFPGAGLIIGASDRQTGTDTLNISQAGKSFPRQIPC